MVSKLRLSFLYLFWSVHLLPLFKSPVLLDILATKSPNPGSLLSEPSLAQNTPFNTSSPLSFHPRVPRMESRRPTTHKGIYVPQQVGFQFPWRAKSFPTSYLPCRCTCRELCRDIRNDQCLVYWEVIIYVFWGLSCLVLNNVGGYFLSVPSPDPPPYPTVLISATIIARNHHVLWLRWPWRLPSCLGSVSGQKLCFICLRVPKLAQSPSIVSSQ